ncbi:MAG: tRNA lysidine(34) synthetase TilS, partial [Actinomycetota bacterium]
PPAPALPVTTLAVPGVTRAPEWGLDVTVQILEELPRDCPPTRSGPSGEEAFLDPGAVDGPLTIRQRRAGDRLYPLGAPGTKKLQDIFVDLKVPRAARDHIPVVTCAGRVAWIPGCRIDRRFAISARGGPALSVRVRRAAGAGVDTPSDTRRAQT